MPEIPYERIEEANEGLQRFHFRIENTLGTIFEGELDFAEGQQYVQIGLASESFPIAEIFWVGEKGYGRQLHSNVWFSIRGKPFPNYLQSALWTLMGGSVISTGEEEIFWIVDIQPKDFPPRDNPEHFYRSIFGELVDPQHKEFLERVIELSRSAEVNIRMRISRRDFLIWDLTVKGQAREIRSELTAAFSPSETVIPPLPDEARQLGDERFQIPVSMLLFRLPSIGGWTCLGSHAPWAQRSIDLIEEKEAKTSVEKRTYQEIYHSKWCTNRFEEGDTLDASKHHPIVLGSSFEDSEGPFPAFYDTWFADDPMHQANKNYYYNFNKGDYKRSYHHYGGDAIGLEYAWYFKFYAPPSTTCGDRFYSARDWGFGGGRINPDLNRLTFTDAIEQYNRYSFEGKRTAYLMLGHVIHLLQDMGQPDHGALVAHPGSSLTGSDINTKYCPILATEAGVIACLSCSWIFGVGCLVCGGGVGGIVLSACFESIRSDEVGYEKLIEGYWSLKRSTVVAEIDKVGFLKESKYDDYFHKLSDFSAGEAKKLNLESPLGCGTLFLPPLPPVPGLNPDIEPGSGEASEYEKLTDAIVPHIIGWSAGLMQHFYEIVNYPPYVERVAIVQWESDDTPRGFAFFKEDESVCVRYDSSWELIRTAKAGSPDLLTRTLTPQSWVKKKTGRYALSPDRSAYVFILFGPTIPPGMGRAMAGSELRLVGTYPVGGKKIDKVVELNLDYDKNVGYYYWGSFEPRNCGNDPYLLTLEISGTDYGAHFDGRVPSGKELDANPATVAMVDTGSSTYSWVPNTYETGIDKNHEIWVLQYTEWEIKPPGPPLVIKLVPHAAGEISIEIQQKAWNCQWEPYWGPVTCPWRWELSELVTRTRNHVEQGTWDKFNIVVKSIAARSGVTLEIRPRWHGEHGTGATTGLYEFQVQFWVGEPPYESSRIAKIQFQLK